MVASSSVGMVVVVAPGGAVDFSATIANVDSPGESASYSISLLFCLNVLVISFCHSPLLNLARAISLASKPLWFIQIFVTLNLITA